MYLQRVSKNQVLGFWISLAILINLFSAIAAHASAGGVSGGGGNLVSPIQSYRNATVEKAELIIDRAYREIDIYISDKKQDLLSGQISSDQREIFELFFEKVPDPILSLREANLEVSEQSPCFDLSANGFDGSFLVSEHERVICISAYTISKKTGIEDIHPQAGALILHEIGEMHGLTEAQAVELQTHVLKDLRNVENSYCR